MFLTEPNQTISAYRSSICLKKKKSFWGILGPFISLTPYF